MLERVLHLEEGVCNRSWESEACRCKEATCRSGVRESGHLPVTGSGSKGNLLAVTSRGDKKASAARNGKRTCPTVPACSGFCKGNLAFLHWVTWAPPRNLTTYLRREEDFAKPGTENEWFTAWGSSSLKPVLGQGNGLDTPLSTWSCHAGFIHRSEYCAAATGLEAMPSSGLSTQDAQDAQVILT